VALLAELLVADDVAGLTDVGPAGILNEGNLLLSSMLTEFDAGALLLGFIGRFSLRLTPVKRAI
jgi:hypothetical protein